MKNRLKTAVAFAVLATFIFSAIPDVFPESSSADDEEFLNKIEHDSFQYFLNEINPDNGLVKDSSRPGSPSSTAAAGFGLAAICIGESKGWISRKEAYDMILKTLHTFRYGVESSHGFFYRFVDINTGDRALDCEVSPLDTAIFVAGALFAAEYFKGTDAEKAAKDIYEKVEWPWMLDGGSTLCKGWWPEGGFSTTRWDSYSEALILYALAIGSPTYPIPKEAWSAWKRPVGSYKEYSMVYAESGSLYTYYYSHAWIDFKNISDSGVNYFNNSVSAAKANRQFCMDNAAQYKTYGEDAWGLTACIGPDGYREYGAEPGRGMHDGTIAPSGMAGSIMFNGEGSIKGLRNIYQKHGNFLYGKYGFKDAFNLDQDWWSEEYLGVDVGVTVLAIENYRTGLVWRHFMGCEAIRKWAASI